MTARGSSRLCRVHATVPPIHVPRHPAVSLLRNWTDLHLYHAGLVRSPRVHNHHDVWLSIDAMFRGLIVLFHIRLDTAERGFPFVYNGVSGAMTDLCPVCLMIS